MIGLRFFLRRTVFDYYKGFLNSVSATRFMLKKYNWEREVVPTDSRLLIFKVDDNFYSGGMADRFKGAVSAYAYCKHKNIDYRIRYVFPFELSDYLIPAEYDWQLKDGEYSESIRNARVIYARAELGRRLSRLKIGRRQIHFYGNYDNLDYLNKVGGTDYTWGGLFKELFKPVPALEQAIRLKTAEIGGSYVSAVFRFQNLLGDFKEYGYTSLKDENDRVELIDKCLKGIFELQRKHPGMPVLVTSDSSTFICKASELPGVHVIGGDRVHIGTGSAENKDTYLNSFIDFFMLAGSARIYSLESGRMYSTQFPLYAAKLNDIPFERIKL